MVGNTYSPTSVFAMLVLLKIITHRELMYENILQIAVPNKIEGTKN
jgi:hypothetical protein